MHPREDLHQRRFACAVLPHQRMHFAAPQVEVDVAQNCNAGEGFGDAFGLKDGILIVGRLSVIGARPPARSDARCHLILNGNAVRGHAHHVPARALNAALSKARTAIGANF